MALAVHGNGWYPVYQDVLTVTIRLHDDGTAVLLTGTHDLGTGSRTVLAQIAGEVLTIDPDLIEVVEADTDTTPLDLGAQASRTTYVAGNATIMAARDLREQVLAEAAAMCKAAAWQLDLHDGAVVSSVNAGFRVGLAEVVTSAQRGTAGTPQRDLLATASFESLDSIDSYAADFCELASQHQNRPGESARLPGRPQLGPHHQPDAVRGSGARGHPDGAGLRPVGRDGHRPGERAR